jgi:hypothetical protein
VAATSAQFEFKRHAQDVVSAEATEVRCGGPSRSQLPTAHLLRDSSVAPEEGKDLVMLKALLVPLTLLAAMATWAASDGGPDDAVLRLGRKLSADFWAGRLDAVWAQMDPAMQKALGGNVSGFAATREKLLAVAAGPGDLVAERVQTVSGIPVYARTFRTAPKGETFQEQWAIQGNRVVGFYVRPPSMFLVETH